MNDIDQFDYELPNELIAQTPSESRSASQLLRFDVQTNQFTVNPFADIGQFLLPGDMLVVNDSQVIPARIMSNKPSGGQVEIMLERVLGETRALVQLRSNKKLRNGQELLFADQVVEVCGRQGRFYEIQTQHDMEMVFKRYGQIPLPPYIDRAPDEQDMSRYQTVYANHIGAVAAPTAGLHFDQLLIESLRDQGILWGSLTLHVGAGTFTPVKTDNIDEHSMHQERIIVGSELVEQIRQTKSNGGRIVAVGTTVVRALESAAVSGTLEAMDTDTNLFIRPGFTFNVVDTLITNFHLPKSTLLMMVSAFAGHRQMVGYYQEAIHRRLRFYSYGDAMMVSAQS